MTNLLIATNSAKRVTDVVATSTLTVQARGVPIFWESTDRTILDWWETASPAQTAPTPTTTSKSSRKVPPPFEDITDQSSTITSSDVTSSSMVTSSSTSTMADPLQPPQGSSGPGGMSTGAQAGIGVGVGLGAVLVGALIYFVLRSRKTQAKMQAMQEQLQGQRGPHEMEYNVAGRIIEVSTTANTPEMPTKANYHELSAVRGQ